MASTYSDGSSSHLSRTQTWMSSPTSDVRSPLSEAPRSRHIDQLRDLASAVAVPLALPKPLMASSRARPQNPSDKPGAEAYLMSLRPKKLLGGKSSKGFASDEIMLALEKSVMDGTSERIVEALLQFAESSGLDNSKSGISAGKKGQGIPTLDYVFSQTENPRSSGIWRLFLGRVSQRAHNNSLAGALNEQRPDVSKVRALLEAGANPDLCHDRIFELVSSSTNFEDLVETILLSPLLDKTEFLNRALVQASPARSLRNVSMLLFRGADINFNHGEALRTAVSRQCYDITLAMLYLAIRPPSASILDDSVSMLGSLSSGMQKSFLVALLYCGSCGPRTSKAVVSYIVEQDEEVMSMLIDSHAFNHGSFPAPKLFQAAIEAGNPALALNILRQSRSRSLSDYASTGVHLQLVQSYNTNPEEILKIITELLTFGTTGDITSEMLLRSCERDQIHGPYMLNLISILIRNGGATVNYKDGKCLLLAVEAGEAPVVKALVAAQPSKKVLSAAVAHVGSVFKEDDLKIELWPILIDAGATGPLVDQQFSLAINDGAKALEKIRVLLPVVSLDYADGDAIIRTIKQQRHDILEMCLAVKQPQASLSWIWKQTRQLFDIAGTLPFSLDYMQRTLDLLYQINRHAAPSNDLLLDAAKCQSKETALSLCQQIIQWGASPDHSLGAPLVACVHRADINTLALLLSARPNKTSLRYAFEKTTAMNKDVRDKLAGMLIDAGLEKAVLDAALPSILQETVYDHSMTHVLVNNGARLHRAVAEILVVPATALDVKIVETLLKRSSTDENYFVTLKSVLDSHSDWQSPNGISLPMVKFLVMQLNPGSWADGLFIDQVNKFNQHGAELFAGHLTSVQTVNYALHGLLSQNKSELSNDKLSMTNYLLKQGATGDVVDEIYLLSVEQLKHDWVTTLDSHVSNAATKSSAFAILSKDEQDDPRNGGRRLEITNFLLRNGLRGDAVDEAFIVAARNRSLSDVSRLLPSISSADTISQALKEVSRDRNFAHSSEGRAVAELLVNNGASNVSVANAIKASTMTESQQCTQLILRLRSQSEVINSAFEGLMETPEPLESDESRKILGYLVEHDLHLDDARRVAHVAAVRHDKALFSIVASSTDTDELYNAAIASTKGTGDRWMSETGLAFVTYLLDNISDRSSVTQLAAIAAESQNASALRILLNAANDKAGVASIAFAAMRFDGSGTLSSNTLDTVKLLLQQGARGPAVEKLASEAARSSDYDTLDVLLSSPAAASILPAAFRAVARDKSNTATADQLSVAAILVKHGVSTELLAIAASEAAKLLDLDILKVLSQSPQFGDVTDDTLRALLFTEELWRSSAGISIIRFLLEHGVSPRSTEATASKAANALDIDVLKSVLSYDQSFETVKVAFNALIGLGSAWLCSEGLRIGELLIQRQLPQGSIDTAFIKACECLNNDAYTLLKPLVADRATISAGLVKATESETAWLSHLHLIASLLNSGAEGASLEAMLIKGARALHYESLQILSSHIKRADVYTNAFAAALDNENWHQSLDVLQLLLGKGAYGKPVDEAYVSAAANLDHRAVQFLAGYVQNKNANDEAFSAATAGQSWQLSSHFDLVQLLFDRGVSARAVDPALIEASQAHNVPVVRMLSQDANEVMASSAFQAAVTGDRDWQSPDGTSVLTMLLHQGARGEAVNKTLLESAASLRVDLVTVCVPNIHRSNTNCFSAAFDAVLRSKEVWFEEPDALKILQYMIDNGASGQMAGPELIEAARNGNLDAIQVVSQAVSEPHVYMEAFNAFRNSGDGWLQLENLEVLECLLSRAVNGAIDDGLHDAMIAATEGVAMHGYPMEILETLLRFGANVNHLNGQALLCAASFAQADLLKLLLQHGPNPIPMYRAMQGALVGGHDEVTVLSLFELLAGPNSSNVRPDVNHNSDLGAPLIFDCLENHPTSMKLAKALCEMDIDLAVPMKCNLYKDTLHKDEIGFDSSDAASPLLFALVVGASDAVISEVLLHNRANVEYVAPRTQTNTLILAARLGRYGVVSTLLDQGARASPQDCRERTPLFYAGRQGDTRAITSLLRKKPIPNDGSLHEAARGLHYDAVKMIIAAGHDVNFTSTKHGGRNPLCELCYECDATQDLVGLHSTLAELSTAKAAPLIKCRGRSPLFFAIENPNPVPVVKKLLEILLWRNHSDAVNVFEQNGYYYSATMYIKKGICKQEQRAADEVLDLLVDLNVEDRFYAKERMAQPHDAVGMPEHIAAQDRRNWLRSSRLEQEEEEHQRKIRYETEIMDRRDHSTTKSHLLSMEHRERDAYQAKYLKDDEQWQKIQFRSMDHAQTTRYQDQLQLHHSDERIVTHQLTSGLNVQTRSAQLTYDRDQSQQKLIYLSGEQQIKFSGAEGQQQLRLGGMRSENDIKREQEMNDLLFRQARSQQERSDMDYRLQNVTDVNANKVFTQRQLEDVSEDSRRAQNRHQEASDAGRLRTEGAMNQYRRQNNDETIRKQETLSALERETLYDKFNMTDQDRQNKLRSNVDLDRQKLDTVYQQGQIQNDTLRDKFYLTDMDRDNQLRSNMNLDRQKLSTLQQQGDIQNTTLRDKTSIVQEGQYNEEDHTRRMGQIRIGNEEDMGEVKYYNEQQMGQVKAQNEHTMGNVRVQNEQNLGNTKVNNEYNMGKAKVHNSAQMGQQAVRNEDALGNAKQRTQAKVGAQQVSNANALGNAQARAAYSRGVAGRRGRGR